MRYRKYDVWITDGASTPLPEYKVDFDRKARTATCYIPSESGKTFAVHCKDMNSVVPHHFALVVRLDGREAGASVCTPRSEVTRIGIRTSSRDTYAAYQFADLETTEDEVAPHVDIGELGTIEVAIELIRPRSIIVPFAPHNLENIGAVNERSKLAGTHCATLGPRITVKPQNDSNLRYHTVPLDPTNTQPFVTFYFKYRPAAVLRAQDINTHIDAPASHTGRALEKALRRSRLQIEALQNRRAMETLDVKPIVQKRAAPDTEAAVTKLAGGKENEDVKPERSFKRVKCEPVD